MDALYEQINYKCQYKSVKTNDMPSALKSKEVDAAIAAINISASLERGFAFSLPYKQSFIQFISLKNSPIKSISHLKNKVIGNYLM